MTRHVLVRSSGRSELVPESVLPLEADLHDALARNPELLPTTDLGLGRVAVVGRESGLASGYADLILVDDAGQLCLVEVKKEGNPDTRQVIAQLIDYAAALWGKSVEEFEKTVVEPFLQAESEAGAGSLDDLIVGQLAPAEAENEAEGVGPTGIDLRNSLEAGSPSRHVNSPGPCPGDRQRFAS
ncbi:MAG: hypothetical protein H0U03_00100 [Actinobacteria bacterium]|nr:hypothetical protein [Actinomycetota bacterium]